MKANELNGKDFRIGNLVKPLVGCLDHIAEITYLSKSRLGIDLIDENYEEYLSISHELKFENIKPIPLTEEWLLKFGYDLISENHYAFCDHLIWSIEDRFYCDKNGIQIKYVHKIQNLFFELKEEELTIKN